MAVARLHQHYPQLQNGSKTVEKVRTSTRTHTHTHTHTRTHAHINTQTDQRNDKR